MGGNAAEQHLHHKQRHGEKHIFTQSFLRRGEHHFRERVFALAVELVRVFAAQEREAPHQQADAQEQKHHRCKRPHIVFSGGHIIDQRLVRPVVGISGIVIGAVGGGGPCSPEEEVGELLARFFAGQGVVFHREMFARGDHGRIIAIKGDVVGRHALNRLDAGVGKHHIAIAAHAALIAVFLGHALAQIGLRGFIQLGIRFAVFGLRGDVQPRHQLAVQPVGCPVGRLISAVAENRAQLHAAGALPGRLAGQNIFFAHQHLAGNGNILLRERRGLAVNLDA